MKVFLSWSGQKSKAIAEALRDWLPSVIQQIRPFMSDEDISAGARWQQRIAEELEGSSYGILCITRENQSAPWLNFEAGAIAKQVSWGHVVPLAIDLSAADIKPPLGQFQGKEMTKSGVLAILLSINAQLDEPLLTVPDLLEVWWPHLQPKLDAAGTASEAVPVRQERDLLVEILTILRAVQADLATRQVLPILEGLRWPTPSSIGAPATKGELEFGHSLLALLPDDAELSFAGGSRRRRLVVATDEGLPEESRAQINGLAEIFGVQILFTRKSDSGGSEHGG